MNFFFPAVPLILGDSEALGGDIADSDCFISSCPSTRLAGCLSKLPAQRRGATNAGAGTVQAEFSRGSSSEAFPASCGEGESG